MNHLTSTNWRRLILLTAWLIGGLASVSHAQIALTGIAEGKGVGAPAGLSFKNGYLLAIDEVNASGGVLGQKIVLTQMDIDTTPADSEAAAIRAVASKPFAILGPVFSGLTLAAMKQTSQSGIPHFTGGEAASLTRKFHPSLLRTSLSQMGSAPRMGALVSYGLEAKKVGLLWIDNEFGRDGRAALLAVLKRRGSAVAVDVPVKPGQVDFTKQVADLMAAQVDALLLYVNEGESIEVLKELKKQGFRQPIVADGLVASQKVIDGAAGAAEGVLAHMGIAVDAPSPYMRGFVSRYTARFGNRPDHNSVKGYFAVHLIKAGLELGGQIDQKGFIKTLRDTRFGIQRYPELLSTVSYDFFGDLNRESHFVVVREGRPRILAAISSIEGGSVELPDGRVITLNSAEFRRELNAAMGSAVNKPATK